MAGKRKLREIQVAIREVMQNNVIDLALMGTKQNPEDFRQNSKLFLYLEIKNTTPAFCHVYDMEMPVKIGRNEADNQICFQDPTVSRDHAVIWEQGGNLYVADASGTNRTGVKRGLFTSWLTGGQYTGLLSRDILLIGSMRIQVRIFRGENEVR